MTPEKRRALKYGRITGNRPLGHGGSRGNGSHLSANAKETSEASKREESRILKQVQKENGN